MRSPDTYVIEDRERSEFLVSRRAFVDPDLLKRERECIFSKCWLYAMHQSELRNPNDFVTRSVGGRELVLLRDRKGEVRAFFNSCPHRGATVVREKSGNALSFQCFYHGWAFNNNGKFATRYREGDYPSDFNSDGCKNLRAVPKLDEYRGLYFVNFDPAAGSLDDYLGGAREYIDLVVDHSAGPMEITDGAQEYSIRANWKLLVENSADGYHALQTHSTYFEYLMKVRGMDRSAMAERTKLSDGFARPLGNGHAIMSGGPSGELSWGRPVAHWVSNWGEEIAAELEQRKAELVARVGPERADIIARWNRNLVIFPNLVINDIHAVTLRTFYPVAPDFMTVNAWSLAPADESQALRARRLENFIEFLGPGGLASPDDQEALEACQTGYRNAAETGWNDISRGMLRGDAPQATDEEQMRAFWREWARRIDQAA